ncbi:MAG: GAF domain-containing sensor histidine kinase [Spartobacteria bacterium]|nr:GAF domain-containing sensor histidine kinase [Spartobacteria bacterium]
MAEETTHINRPVNPGTPEEMVCFLERLRALHAVTNELSRLESIDDLFRRAVELGREQLRFDRLGVLLIDREKQEMIGTYGTDEEGVLRDERGKRSSYAIDDCMRRVLEQHVAFAMSSNGEIYNHRTEVVGYGVRAIAGLWDGEDVVGFLSTDNLLTGSEINEHDCELLTLYASSLGHLFARLRAATELRKKEEELRHAQKLEAIGRLAGGVAHDFNNLLTSILGFGTIVKDTLGPENALYGDMEELLLSAQRAAKLTNQLLTFGRKTIAHVRPIMINEAVEEMNRLLNRTLGKDIELVILLGEDMGYVVMDPGHLDQVIMNLAVNARDAMPDGGKLTIRTERMKLAEPLPKCPAGDYNVISVEDEGIGIPRDVLRHVFDPFFTTKEAGKGTGLGLSIVSGIVDQCGGDITVRTTPGEGTAFKIYLPCINQVDTPYLGTLRKRELPSGTETILVVEDEASVRRVTIKTLQGLGYTTMQAPHGGEALRIYEELHGKIDMILTDVMMPHMGASELIERVRMINPKCKILYTSGFVDQEEFDRDFKDRKARLLLKPYTREGLANAVRLVLDSE